MGRHREKRYLCPKCGAENYSKFILCEYHKTDECCYKKHLAVQHLK